LPRGFRTDPVKREQKKYRMQQIARQGALIRRIMFWLPIAFSAA
jgi:hypothetical protein